MVYSPGGQISIAVFFSTRCTRETLFYTKNKKIKEFKRNDFIVQKRFFRLKFQWRSPFLFFAMISTDSERNWGGLPIDFEMLLIGSPIDFERILDGFPIAFVRCLI